jgi:hypothetical protein
LALPPRIGTALCLAALFAPAAYAGDVTFEIKNSHPNAMRVELYSHDRDYVWPGEDQDYYLSDGETKSIPLSCKDGESICSGAWSTATRARIGASAPATPKNATIAATPAAAARPRKSIWCREWALSLLPLWEKVASRSEVG